MKITFWCDMVSPHLAPFFRELSTKVDRVTLIVPQLTSKNRREFGWALPDCGFTEVIVNPTAADVMKLVRERTEEIHVFAGTHVVPMVKMAARLCTRDRLRCGFISERGDPKGWFGLKEVARGIRDKADALKRGNSFHFVLGMGGYAVDWFVRHGYPVKRVFPFMYSTESNQDRYVPEFHANKFRYLYIGQLIERKRVDVLLRGLSGVDGDWQLDVVGDGPDRDKLLSLSYDLGIADYIKWHGVQPMETMLNFLVKSDLLVLPSRHDGWGATVNEALLAGVPVVCTDQCGSKSLIGEGWRGLVVQANDVSSMRVALIEWYSRRSELPVLKQCIKEWATCIDGKSVASYFIAVMEHVFEDAPRPCPPWDGGPQIDDLLSSVSLEVKDEL